MEDCDYRPVSLSGIVVCFASCCVVVVAFSGGHEAGVLAEALFPYPTPQIPP